MFLIFRENEEPIKDSLIILLTKTEDRDALSNINATYGI
ncbi:hypothetical protein SDC9_164210 [bioreactor metagenome]|uniref:Uncharacterized protein n=1 Tax=bioreactor metagenome TaxID=1076179 RepID=A0A645FY80_9ZZZZ